ncbi:hypothetical protein B9Z19DRAFT_1128509 [Tuber borchii]|uniref:Uncharacterized protein n=1 Tax=Tuber borchii TaxID=42251 RepID=A0A2T6ZP31_TUBBO|nr:hypothetical protein B9Z19DRAFT_1128509 [Tuber borchii]
MKSAILGILKHHRTALITAIGGGGIGYCQKIYDKDERIKDRLHQEELLEKNS